MLSADHVTPQSWVTNSANLVKVCHVGRRQRPALGGGRKWRPGPSQRRHHSSHVRGCHVTQRVPAVLRAQRRSVLR